MRGRLLPVLFYSCLHFQFEKAFLDNFLGPKNLSKILVWLRHNPKLKPFLKEAATPPIYSCFRFWCDGNIYARQFFGAWNPLRLTRKFYLTPYRKKNRNRKWGGKTLVRTPSTVTSIRQIHISNFLKPPDNA